MTYKEKYFRRVIHKDTHEFIRDIDLNYDQPNSSYIDKEGVEHTRENEIAIVAPACVGECRRWSYELKRWIN